MAPPRKILFCFVLSFCLLSSVLSMPYHPEEDEEDANDLEFEDEPVLQNIEKRELGHIEEDDDDDDKNENGDQNDEHDTDDADETDKNDENVDWDEFFYREFGIILPGRFPSDTDVNDEKSYVPEERDEDETNASKNDDDTEQETFDFEKKQEDDLDEDEVEDIQRNRRGLGEEDDEYSPEDYFTEEDEGFDDEDEDFDWIYKK